MHCCAMQIQVSLSYAAAILQQSSTLRCRMQPQTGKLASTLIAGLIKLPFIKQLLHP